MNTVWTLLYLLNLNTPVVLTQHATQAQCEATLSVVAANMAERSLNQDRVKRAMVCVESFARK